MLRKSFENKSEIDPETLMILNSKSPFSQSCLRFCGEKAWPYQILLRQKVALLNPKKE